MALRLCVGPATNKNVTTTETGKKRNVGGRGNKFKRETYTKKKGKKKNHNLPLQELYWTTGNKLQQLEGLEGLEIGTTKATFAWEMSAWEYGNMGKLYVTGQAAGLVSTAASSGKSRTHIECYGQSFFAREQENCFAWNRFIPRLYLGQRGQRK